MMGHPELQIIERDELATLRRDCFILGVAFGAIAVCLGWGLLWQ